MAVSSAKVAMAMSLLREPAGGGAAGGPYFTGGLLRPETIPEHVYANYHARKALSKIWSTIYYTKY
jgi:hypothetical protein